MKDCRQNYAPILSIPLLFIYCCYFCCISLRTSQTAVIPNMDPHCGSTDFDRNHASLYLINARYWSKIANFTIQLLFQGSGCYPSNFVTAFGPVWGSKPRMTFDIAISIFECDGRNRTTVINFTALCTRENDCIGMKLTKLNQEVHPRDMPTNGRYLGKR